MFCITLQFHSDYHEDHHTIDIEEYQKQIKKHQRKVCTRHGDQPLKFCCKVCPDILCEDCFLESDGCAGK